ncbi:MAG TPA: site-specific integrase [Ruminococcaceae bacterium]|nr:site-specific integrase [Oscillospiraceae bacterium]
MPKKRNAKRKDGRIPVQVYLGRVDGKRKYKTVYGQTQKEANEKARQVKIEIDHGVDVTAEQDTFSMWADSFLKKKKASEVSESQYRNYKGTVKYLKEQIGSMHIKDIRVQVLQDIINSLVEYNPHTAQPTSKRTLKFVLSTARQIIQLAVKNRVITYNTANDVDIPTNAPQEHRRALTEKEQQWIIDTPHRAQRAAMIMMYAGLRRGELIPLTWNDIDLKKKTIRINKAVAIKDGKLQVKPFTKSEAGMRTIDVPQRLVDFLTKERKQAFGGSAVNPLVCPAVNGGLMTDTAWRRMWSSYLTELNFKYGNRMDKNGKVAKSKYDSNGIVMTIPHFTAHWLRHTFATLLYMAGVDVLTAKEQLGHADIKTTLQIYTHLDKQFKRKSMSKLDDYLSKCKSNASQANAPNRMNAE